VLVGSAIAVVATTAALVATWNGAVWAFEVVAMLGIVVGLAVAFGGLDLRAARRRTRRRLHVGSSAVPRVARVTAELLDGLDPVEHRRLDLGDPWPVVIVGPTGVNVVAVASDHHPAADVRRLGEVLGAVASAVAALPAHRGVDVRGLLVVERGRGPSTPADVQTVTPDQLVSVIGHGSLVPMATVTAVFVRLSGMLAPDLRLGAR
jgi:hypothetical protein